MTIKELITELLEYPMNADIQIAINTDKDDYDIFYPQEKECLCGDESSITIIAI